MSDPFSMIGGYYDRLVDRYGHDPRACDYGRPESQLVKFDILSGVAPLAGRRVLDVGCGFADYYSFLVRRFPDVSYTGLDLSERMVTAARRLHPGLDIRAGDLLSSELEKFDVVFANGIFYLLGLRAPELSRRLIERMYALATEAVAFNSLSTRAPDPQPEEYYADPAALLDFCLELTPRALLRHDYHPRDFTVFLYR